jgi:pimeloyl-ACP methyl ester carboxylesterase
MGLDWFEAHVHGELGKMPAWVVPQHRDKANSKWAILVHGRGGSPASCIEVLPAFRLAGYSTLSISYRGDGVAPDSPDGLDHLGDHEWRDLERAVEPAVLSGADEIVLYGRSAGGQIVGQFLGRGQESLVSKVTHVILDCPVMNWLETFLHNRPDWMPRWAGRLICWVASLRLGKKMSSFDLTSHPPQHKPRTLIIHGLQDEVVPYSESKRFVDTHSTGEWPLMLVGVPAGHGDVRAKDPKWYDLLLSVWVQSTHWHPQAVKEMLEDARERRSS